jgi:hypothetical protein
MDDAGLVTAYFTGQIDGPVLDALAARESFVASVGGEEDDSEPAVSFPGGPRSPRSAAVDPCRINSAWPAAGQPTSDAPDAPAAAGLDCSLRHYSITAFARPGGKQSILGTGSAVRPPGIDEAGTRSLAPGATVACASGSEPG